jgi:hypothetical protein
MPRIEFPALSSLLPRLRPASLAIVMLVSGCIGTGTLDPGTANTATDNRRAFQAVRISASWTAGKTGLPSTRTVTPPAGFFGTLCAASDFVVENHPTNYTTLPGGVATLFVVGSNCAIPTYVAVCRGGSSGAGQTSAFPACAADPRFTEGGTISMLRVAASSLARPISFGETSTTLDVELFFCSDRSAFNFMMAVPKAGVAPTDCVEQ